MNKNRRKKREKGIEYERFNRSIAFDSRTKVDIVYDSETHGAHCTLHNYAFVLIVVVALAMRIKFLTLFHIFHCCMRLRVFSPHFK